MTISQHAHPHRPALAHTLSRAFYNDPLFIHFFPNNANRQVMNRYSFRLMLNHAARKGEIVTAADNLAAAIWCHSDNMHYSTLDILRFGGLPGILRQGPRAVLRQLHAVDEMMARHNTVIAQPHYYLAALGVDPCRQGQGLGSVLLRPTLARLDQQQLPCYLDTHNENNVSLYRRFGFEVVHQGHLANGAVPHWGMLRTPQP